MHSNKLYDPVKFTIITGSLQTVYQVKYMYIKQFNECFGCTKSFLFPRQCVCPTLVNGRTSWIQSRSASKITPFIHWEMGFSRLANTIWKGRRLFSVLGHCGSPPKTTCIYCGDLSCDTHFTGIFLLHKLIFWLPFFHILFLHVHEC